jgi:hypothetical protein
MTGLQDWRISVKRALLLGVAVATAIATSPVRTATQTVSAFAALSEQLSEPNGEFDTDNLISNESSYLHVMPALEQGGVTGGVYIGVGPDQNFSYIARIRPASAFIIDIRRDNLLMHLLFKALFASARTRVEYLAILTGRPAPDRPDTWRDAGIEKIVMYLDGAKPLAASALAANAERLHDAIRKTGLAQSDRDLAAIDRFHGQFIRAGLGLQFQSTGRPAREYYPTYRDLLLETDRRGRRLCYLASEDDFQFVKGLEAKDLIVPVVGNLAGPHALAAIGQEIARRGEKVSAFYNSNIENYLFRDGSFQRYMENVKTLPHTDKSVVIRSLFGGYALPESVPGYYSTQAVQTINELIANCGASRCRGYFDLLKR